jgi:hypothetical protein
MMREHIIVMIVTDIKNLPEFTAGRIQLAWASLSDNISLRLKTIAAVCASLQSSLL